MCVVRGVCVLRGMCVGVVGEEGVVKINWRDLLLAVPNCYTLETKPLLKSNVRKQKSTFQIRSQSSKTKAKSRIHNKLASA